MKPCKLYPNVPAIFFVPVALTLVIMTAAAALHAAIEQPGRDKDGVAVAAAVRGTNMAIDERTVNKRGGEHLRYLEARLAVPPITPPSMPRENG